MGTFHNELIIENDIFSHFAALAFSFVVRIIFLQTEIQCRARHESHISRSERNWCNSRSAFLHLLSSIKIWSLYWWMLHIVIRWKNVETLLQRVLLVFQRHWCYVMYFSLTYYLLIIQQSYWTVSFEIFYCLFVSLPCLHLSQKVMWCGWLTLIGGE